MIGKGTMTPQTQLSVTTHDIYCHLHAYTPHKFPLQYIRSGTAGIHIATLPDCRCLLELWQCNRLAYWACGEGLLRGRPLRLGAASGAACCSATAAAAGAGGGGGAAPDGSACAAAAAAGLGFLLAALAGRAAGAGEAVVVRELVLLLAVGGVVACCVPPTLEP